MNSRHFIWFVVIYFLLVPITNLQSQFIGGTGDGWINSNIFQSRLNGDQPNTIPMYQGGHGEGHSNEFLNTTLNVSLSVMFRGRYGDGFNLVDQSSTLSGETLISLYNGSSGDGHVLNTFSSTLSGQSMVSLYRGGADDGHDFDPYAGTLGGSSMAMLYDGGHSEGHDYNQVLTALDGAKIDFYRGGEGDGQDYNMAASTLNGYNLSGIYGGGFYDGFDEVLTQIIIKSADCTIVINDQDDGFGSLRYAINCAEPGDTISFGEEVTGDTIMMTSGVIELNQHISIITEPNRDIYVDASETDRNFDVAEGQQVIIAGLKLIAGQNQSGSGILNKGILTLIDLTIIRSNPASSAIHNTFTPTNSLTIEGTCYFVEE